MGSAITHNGRQSRSREEPTERAGTGAYIYETEEACEKGEERRGPQRQTRRRRSFTRSRSSDADDRIHPSANRWPTSQEHHQPSSREPDATGQDREAILP